MRTVVLRCVAAVAICCAALSVGIGAAFTGISLKVSKETAPPGGFAQAKVFVTEPKPISTGSTSISFSAFDEVVGIALMSPAQDTYGVALVRGSGINLSLLSTTGSFGTSIDYPILTVVGHLPATTPLGASYPLALDPAAIQLLDPSGALYPVEVNAGAVTAAAGVSISDVSPGSATLAAGDVVSIAGANFTPKTDIRFAEAKLSSIRYVNSCRIDVTLAQPASMHGMQIKATNPNGSAAMYFSYQRTRSVSPSTDPVLQYAMPVLPPLGTTAATVALPSFSATTTPGVAIQNIGNADATVTVDLLDVNGTVVASAGLLVPPSRFVVRAITEIFGFPAAQPDMLRVSSSTPVQVLGIVADQSTHTAWPIVPQQ